MLRSRELASRLRLNVECDYRYCRLHLWLFRYRVCDGTLGCQSRPSQWPGWAGSIVVWTDGRSCRRRGYALIRLSDAPSRKAAATSLPFEGAHKRLNIGWRRAEMNTS
jgi:hypothetical protein